MNEAARQEEERYFALITKKARLLFAALPGAGFTQATFEELGRAAQLGRSFDHLSNELKATIIRLAANFDSDVKALEVENSVIESVNEGKASTSEPTTEEESDESEGEDTEDEETESEKPADDLPPEAKPPVQPNPPAEPTPIEMPEPSGEPKVPPKMSPEVSSTL